MGLKEKALNSAERVVTGVVERLSEDEKRTVLHWSEKALVIRNDESLPTKGKISALSRLETPEVTKIVFMKIFEIFMGKVWTGQSWTRRLGFAGFAAGGIAFGGTGVGIATLGAGIGLPLMVMTAAGGAILGAMIEELQQEIEPKDKK